MKVTIFAIGVLIMTKDTKYNFVKNEIMNWIIEGKVKPGEKIWSENQMMKIFNVSRHTIRQAVGELVNEGWLYREQGAGTFCKAIEQPVKESSDKNIGLITTYISDYIFPSIIRGIEQYVTSKGYSLVFASTNNDVEKEKMCLQMMMSKNLDGLIIEPTKSAYQNPNIHYYLLLEERNIPYLMINAYYHELNPSYIIVDDELGAFLLTEHLIKLGHRKIAGLFKTDDQQGINRLRGYIRAFRTYDIPLDSNLVVTYQTEEKTTKPISMIESILKSETNAPTGIVCYNDELALNILEVIRSLHLKVPDDVSVVGFDDSQLAVASEVKLTTVTHPKMDLGIEAAKRIIRMIEGKKSEEELTKIFTPELIIRESTKPIS